MIMIVIRGPIEEGEGLEEREAVAEGGGFVEDEEDEGGGGRGGG